MKIAISGASGFLGKVVCEHLRDDHELLLIDKLTGVDLLDWKQIEALPPFDCFIHLAARSYVPDSYEEPRSFYETNVMGTLNALEISRRHNARFVFISSYVYGHPQYLPIDENHPLAAFNPYAQTKVIGESLCEGYHRDFKMDITIFRPFNLYGYGQPPHFLISKIIQQAKAAETIDLFDGRPKRDYIHVKDVAGAIKKAAESRASGFSVYNLGSGKSVSIPEIIEIVDRHLKTRSKVNYLNKIRPNEILDTVCNANKVRNELGWRPEVSFSDGLNEMVHKG